MGFECSWSWGLAPSRLRGVDLDSSPRLFKLFMPARRVLGGCKEDVAMLRGIVGQPRDLFSKLLIAVWMGCREDFGGHQSGRYAFDVTSAGGPKSQSESTSLWVKFDQLLDSSQRNQDRERLIELLNHIQWAACQRVMPNCVEAQLFENRHWLAFDSAEPCNCACRAVENLSVHLLGIGDGANGRSAMVQERSPYYA